LGEEIGEDPLNDLFEKTKRDNHDDQIFAVDEVINEAGIEASILGTKAILSETRLPAA
jgi:hypothetical protein